MKIVTLVSSIITVLVATATMYCGLTLRANNVTDPIYINFHQTIGIATVVLCIITTLLMIINLTLAAKKHKQSTK